jgi:hypothetical protein
MNYNENSLKEAVEKEKKYKDFVANMKIEMKQKGMEMD